MLQFLLPRAELHFGDVLCWLHLGWLLNFGMEGEDPRPVAAESPMPRHILAFLEKAAKPGAEKQKAHHDHEQSQGAGVLGTWTKPPRAAGYFG